MRILILGNGGSGKTTLAQQISTRFKWPLLSLDALYWRENYQKWPMEVFIEKTHDFISRHDAWVIEGTPEKDIRFRLEKATHVIFLDVPTWRCLWRIFLRQIKRGANQQAGTLSLKTLKWVFFYKQRNGRALLEIIDSKKVIIIRSRSQIKALILDLKTSL